MDKITINGSTSYNVLIERNILDNVGNILAGELGGNKALVVTDTHVAALYLGEVSDSLEEAGYDVTSLKLSPGEETKNIDNYVFVLNTLSENDFSTSDLIIALGGGTIGDLVGFVASTYKRGMKCIQIPTTLLACVDSSIGGKSAVNLTTGKNQVGTIKNPSIVFCDPNVVSSLSKNALLEGYAEIIKYGILDGLEIVKLLREAIESKDYSEVVAKAISIKKSYVEEDECDSNSRQFLNLGHFVGHAIEAASGYSISHGKAVALGLVIESKCCALSGLCEMSSYLEISSIIREFGFDDTNHYGLQELLPYILRDKRIRDGKIDIIVPARIGNCILRKIPASDLEDFLRLGL